MALFGSAKLNSNKDVSASLVLRHNHRHLSDLTATLASHWHLQIGPASAVPLSRENIFELLLIVPFLILLLGIWGMLCPACCCCRDKPAWQKVPISWMTGLTCVQMPFIFLFAGMFWVFIIMWSDGCQSYGGLAMQYVDGMGDDLCTERFNGNGTLAACMYSKSVTVMDTKLDLNATVDLHNAALSVIGGCPGECACACLRFSLLCVTILDSFVHWHRMQPRSTTPSATLSASCPLRFARLATIWCSSTWKTTTAAAFRSASPCKTSCSTLHLMPA